MCPMDREPRPETQWDLHRPKGHPRPREAKSQKAQLESELKHGELKEVKRPMSSKLTSPRSDDGSERDKRNELTAMAQRVLSEDKDLRSYDLNADVTLDGDARVTGIVDTLSERMRAEELLSQINGVSQVENGISISTDGRITDESVQMEVSEEIALDDRVRSIPDIRVERGHVTLTGTVDSEEEKKAIVQAASKARGVTGIADNLQVDDGSIDWDDPEAVFHSQVRNDREKGIKPI